jgi:putative molybdopterin biosynthesis protein
VVTCSAARAHGLGFIPLAAERFDLVLPREALSDARVSRLLDTLSTAAYRRELEDLGGYATASTGAQRPSV